MQKLQNCIRNGKFEDMSGLEPFKKIFEELTVSDEGLILRDVRLIIPEVLKDQIINIAHEGHLGLIKMKRLLRSKVWFPMIHTLVENKIQNCMACQAIDKSGLSTTPVKMSVMPWEKVSIDFFGPNKRIFNGGS